MKNAIQKAKIGRDEELGALKRLDEQARRLERNVEGPSLGTFIANEMSASPDLDGRSVFGWERDLQATEPRSVTDGAPSRTRKP